MNARVLELIKNPEIIQHQDLDLLNSEIKKHPYLQNIRALHLIGTHKFDRDNYQKELSVTAAYTTDKKILYQLINKKTEIISLENNPESVAAEAKTPEEFSASKTFNDVEVIEKPTAKPVFVAGTLNRILFEGEEDFLERENEKIDIESTLESGKIVTQSIVKEENNITKLTEKSQFTETEDAENFSPETVVNELAISKEEPVVEDSSKISFHGLEEFLPDIKIISTNSDAHFEAPKAQPNKQELEMQRLIAEVEAKIAASKKEKTAEIEIKKDDHNSKFPESQNVDVTLSKEEIILEKAANSTADKIDQKREKVTEVIPFKEELAEESAEPEKSDWKPMQFSGNIPDSLIDKNSEAKSAEKSTISDKSDIENKSDLEVEEVTDHLKSETRGSEFQELQKKDAHLQNSNIPNFINTWQTWLKIDRENEVIQEKPILSKEEVKNTVIEKFIEKEPKISKLKDESDFVVKEKGTNISHLMTETLANLYVEQKLYAKAIKAYEILAEKHPKKEEKFRERILEIKDLRKNP